MEDLLKGILGGGQSQKSSRKTAPDPLTDLLGGILGGALGQQPSGGQKGGGGLQDILGGILGGADAQQPSGGQTGAGGLQDILGGILGGAGAQQPSSGQAGAGGMGDILGGILGGADGQLDAGDLAGILGGILGGGGATAPRAQPSSGGLGDILGGILGAGKANLGANSFLAPIIQELAGRLGLSPAIAGLIVSFVLGKILPGLAGGKAAAQPSPVPGGQAQGLDLDHLLESMGSGQQLEPSYFQQSGMAGELAQQTGLDQQTAAQGLQQVFELLGSQLAAGREKPSSTKASELDHLLDSWED
jgi:hypothetical protein